MCTKQHNNSLVSFVQSNITVAWYKWHQCVAMLLCINDTNGLLCYFVQMTPRSCYVALYTRHKELLCCFVHMTPMGCYIALYKWHQGVVMLLCTNDTKELLCYFVQMTPRSCYVTLYKWHQGVVMLLCTNDTKGLLCYFVQMTPRGCYVALYRWHQGVVIETSKQKQISKPMKEVVFYKIIFKGLIG
jgi:hypothetical protein